MAEVELIGVGAGLGAVLIAALLFFIYLRQSRRAAQRAEERKNAPPPPPLPVSAAPRGDVPEPAVPFEAAPLDSAASPRLVRGGSSPRLKGLAGPPAKRRKWDYTPKDNSPLGPGQPLAREPSALSLGEAAAAAASGDVAAPDGAR